MLPSRQLMVLTVATLVGMVAMACADSEAPVETEEPTPARAATEVPAALAEPTPAVASTQVSDTPVPPSPTSTDVAASRPTPEPVVRSADYDSNEMMYEMLRGLMTPSRSMMDSLDQIGVQQDRSMVPVLIEMVRFMPFSSQRERVGAVLREVTGQDLTTIDWGGWMEWLGRNLEHYQPPPKYVEWKSDLMQNVHPRFPGFLLPAAEFSRIDVTEVVWGGVPPDGIPDLRDPETLTAAEATYLLDSDRVFGLTINGESRAYPLRIVNAHEMVNDTVGGEPISLMW